MTSDDKLLQQLLGKKAAKAHIAARQAPKDNSNIPKPGPGLRSAKPEESEDEEEGRAATFRSKRRKTVQTTQTEKADDLSEDLQKTSELESGSKMDEDAIPPAKKQPPKENDAKDQSPQPPHKSKSASYLDEILAERSKRKKRKTKNKDATTT